MRGGAFTSRALLAALVCAWLARCTFDGLDAYDQGGDAADVAVNDVAADSPADAGCNCGTSQTCVLGKCETCPATWTLSHPLGVSVGGEVLDPTSNVLYVAGSRSVGDAGATTGYLALVDSCTGVLIDAFDAPKVGAQTIPGLGQPGLIGGKLYLHAAAPPGVPGGYARFDVASKTFDGLLATLPPFSSGLNETWQMAVGAQSVWFSGDRSYDQPDAALPVVVKSDGDGGVCATTLTLVGDERAGRAITVSGNDVYEIATSGAAVIRHFDATQCTLQPCACNPTWTSAQYAGTGIFMGAFQAVVVGQKLYFGGVLGITADLANMEGFVTYYDLSASQFASSPYFYNPSSLEDGFLLLRSDGTRLYAAGGHDTVNLDFSTAQGVVVILNLSLGVIATIPTPSVRPSGGLDPVPGGFILSGFGATANAAAGTVRCTMQQCP